MDALVRSFEFGMFFVDIKCGDFDVYLLDVFEFMEPDMLRWMFYGLGTLWKMFVAEGTVYVKVDCCFFFLGVLSVEVLNDLVCGFWFWLVVRDVIRNWVLDVYGIFFLYSIVNCMGYMNFLVDCWLELG